MEIIQWLQSFSSPAADVFWGALSQMNTETFMVLLMTLIFWCVDARSGWLLANLYLASVVVHDSLKLVTNVSRPSADDVRVLHVETAFGSSMPSGHAQDATVFWGYVAWRLRRRWVTALAAVMILLVAISRVYLGLHWPADVVAGIAVGAVILAAGIALSRRWLAGRSWDMALPARVLLVAIPALVFVLVPRELIPMATGFAAGVNLGVLWLWPRTGGAFPVRVGLPAQALKLLIGWGGLMLLRVALKALLPETELADFMRYVTLGLWAGWVAPLVFALVLKRSPAPAPGAA
jgi:membrane-associated phospholipid phosphatase